jgi:hypothetical protein
VGSIGLHEQPTIVRVHESPGDGQTQPGTFGFGRKKGSKYPFEILRQHAFTAVGNLQTNPRRVILDR